MVERSLLPPPRRLGPSSVAWQSTFCFLVLSCRGLSLDRRVVTKRPVSVRKTWSPERQRGAVGHPPPPPVDAPALVPAAAPAAVERGWSRAHYATLATLFASHGCGMFCRAQ